MSRCPWVIGRSVDPIKDLIHEARAMSGLDRISMRDPIAEHGSSAIGPMIRLLGDETMGNFAIVVLRKIGDLGCRREVIDSLQRYPGPYASDAVEHDAATEAARQRQLVQQEATQAAESIAAAGRAAVEARRARLSNAMRSRVL